jgi:hypothetical protein
MRPLVIVAFGVTMLGLGSFVNTRAQEQSTQQSGSRESVYLAVVPQIGQEVWMGASTCTVREVRREWIRCDDVPQWWNVYNGQRYTVRVPERR